MVKIRRRRYLINKPLQFAFSGLAIWLLLIGIILTGTLTYSLTLNTVLETMATAEPKLAAQAAQILTEINQTLGKRLALLLGSLIFLTGVLEVLYLHRIAGPIYRIEQSLRNFQEGKPFTPIRLRQKDFFKELAEALNNLMAYQQEKEERIKEFLQLTSNYQELKEKGDQLKKLLS